MSSEWTAFMESVVRLDRTGVEQSHHHRALFYVALLQIIDNSVRACSRMEDLVQTIQIH